MVRWSLLAIGTGLSGIYGYQLTMVTSVDVCYISTASVLATSLWKPLSSENTRVSKEMKCIVSVVSCHLLIVCSMCVGHCSLDAYWSLCWIQGMYISEVEYIYRHKL